MKRISLFVACLLLAVFVDGQNKKPARILPGVERLDIFLPFLKEKRVGIFANQTSMVGNTHLVDTLRKLGVDIKVIFGPEHGFRGTADAGEKVGNYVDEKTGIPVVSLYGSKRKPSAEDVKDVDLLIFDIQDVGVRFYTFISSLENFIEASIELKKQLVIFDRPNPNGHYVDGPVLDKKYKSFVGMQAIPIVYGMTIGEYAQMLVQEFLIDGLLSYNISILPDMTDIEGVLKKADYPKTPPLKLSEDEIKNYKVPDHHASIIIVKCANYTHKSKYFLPIRPSPNLPNIQSIYLYPSTCLFEGTVLSEGRGTNKQFQVFGHPSLPNNLYSFTPNPNEGAKNSKLYGQLCYGWDLSGTPEEVSRKVDNKVQLKWLMEGYKLFPEKEKFFILPKSGNMEESFFNKLAGNNDLWQQIRDGKSEAEIRASWEPALSNFKKMRKKYLLYEDF